MLDATLSSSSPPHTQTHRRTFSICALTSLTSIVVVLVAPAHSAGQSMGCLLLLRREGLRAALALFFLWLVRLALPPSSFQARPPQERPRRLRCVTVCQEMVCEYVCVWGGGDRACGFPRTAMRQTVNQKQQEVIRRSPTAADHGPYWLDGIRYEV